MTHMYCMLSKILRIWLTGAEDMTHEYCIPSQVLHTLTGTAYSLYRVRNVREIFGMVSFLPHNKLLTGLLGEILSSCIRLLNSKL